jgi:outer membrane protein assembly factor BamB
VPCLQFIVRAYDAATGVVLWDNRIGGALGATLGPTGVGVWRIALDNKRVFAIGQGELASESATHDRPYYWLRALDQATGTLLWDDPGASTPTMARGIGVTTGGGRVFGVGYAVPSGDAHDGTNFFVRAHDGATGTVLWQDELVFGQYSDAYTVLYVPGRVLLPIIGSDAISPAAAVPGAHTKGLVVVAGFGTNAFGDGRRAGQGIRSCDGTARMASGDIHVWTARRVPRTDPIREAPRGGRHELEGHLARLGRFSASGGNDRRLRALSTPRCR